jgi:hypothetical protein
MIMFGSFLPSPLVGFSTTNFTRAWEPTLSWNQLHSPTELQVPSALFLLPASESRPHDIPILKQAKTKIREPAIKSTEAWEALGGSSLS